MANDATVPLPKSNEMKITDFLLRLLVLVACLQPVPVHADDVTFFKNSGQYRMFVWVNGSYQGFVDPGTTVYMPREGFVTQDSGFQPDGTLKTTHSHGGWDAKGLFEYQAFSASFEMDGSKVAYYTTATVPYKQGDKRLGLASGKEATNAVLPSDYDTETAGKMQGGRPPGDLQSLLSVGKEELPYGGGANPAGSITDGASAPVWYAGRKKKEEMAATATFTNSIGMKMIWVKPGTIQGMRIIDFYKNKNIRNITVNMGYYLSSTEVTQRQWVVIMGSNPSRIKGDSLPVESVTWNDANLFCNRLTAHEQRANNLPKGLIYGLPTEEQWEFACRAGTTSDNPGSLEAMAWTRYDSAEKTRPVATKQSNPWGFYDMQGNVWELCSNNWLGSDVLKEKRGGSVGYDISYSSGYTEGVYPNRPNKNLGFRPALRKLDN